MGSRGKLSVTGLASCVHDHTLDYIQEAKKLKEVWENLNQILAVNTATRKLQLHQGLNNVQQRDVSITSYTLKIKELCDSLGTINVNIDDDEMVQSCLNDLTPQFGTMRIVILARENPPSFFDLQSMLHEDYYLRLFLWIGSNGYQTIIPCFRTWLPALSSTLAHYVPSYTHTYPTT